MLYVKEKEIYIPIENNIVKYVWIFESKKDFINYDFIEVEKIGEIILSQLENKDWSVMYYYDEIEYDLLPAIDKYLMVKLCNEALLFLSVFNFVKE